MADPLWFVALVACGAGVLAVVAFVGLGALALALGRPLRLLGTARFGAQSEVSVAVEVPGAPHATGAELAPMEPRTGELPARLGNRPQADDAAPGQGQPPELPSQNAASGQPGAPGEGSQGVNDGDSPH